MDSQFRLYYASSESGIKSFEDAWDYLFFPPMRLSAIKEPIIEIKASFSRLSFANSRIA